MKNSQNPQPLVSVIIPNYNHARYLDQRIQTVLGQTYQNFEVIILDDCSTDNSLEVIEKYRSDPRIVDVIVNEKNSGNTFLQWNKGIYLAKGELIWIAESDDYCKLNMLEELVSAFILKPNTILSYCTPLLFHNEKTWEYSPEGRDYLMSAKSYLRRFLLNMNWPLNASCCVFRRDSALRNAKRYLTIDAAGDYMFWAELLVSGGSVHVINKHLSMWRKHEGSVTSPLLQNGRIALSEKEIFDFICSSIRVGYFRKRFALRYHFNRFSHFGIKSQNVFDKIENKWRFDEISSYSFGDKVYNKVNYLLRKYTGLFLSY